MWVAAAPGLALASRPSSQPTDEVAGACVADKQGQAEGCLVEVALAQLAHRHGTAGEVCGLGTGAGSFAIAAVVETFKALEPRARWLGREGCRHIGPRRRPMLVGVAESDIIGDALQLDQALKPVEDGAGVLPGHRRLHAVVGEVGSQIVEERRWSPEQGGLDDLESVVEPGRVETGRRGSG